jgi:TMEM175 potassium channel family protein
VTFYGLVLLALNVALNALWRYALAAHHLRAGADPQRVRALTDKLTPGLGLYVIAVIVGLVLPIAAVLLYLFIAIYLFLPLRLFYRLRRGHV